MKFYLETDLRDSSYFVVPWSQTESDRYVIRFKERFKAEQFLKGLSFGKFKDPLIAAKDYQLKEELELKGKIVKVYEPK